jgi:hypothetical protein
MNVGRSQFRHPTDRIPPPAAPFLPKLIRSLHSSSRLAVQNRRHRRYPFRVGSSGEFGWRQRAALVIEPSLRRQSLQNGNIPGHGRRLSPICVLRLPIREPGDEVNRAKCRHFRPILAFPGEFGQTPDCLAGDPVLIAPVSTQIPCYQGI